MKILYSADGRHYYLSEADDNGVNRPTSWVPVADDGAILPFPFWKVRAGREEEIAADHPLVARYFALDRWLTPGTPEWRERATRILANSESRLSDLVEEVSHLRARCERLHAQLHPAPVSAENSGAGEAGGLLVP